MSNSVLEGSTSAPWRPVNWPLAIKIAAFTVAMCFFEALTLAALGYVRASDGLREQAQAALGADALVAVNSVDSWHEQRLSNLQGLALIPQVELYLEANGSERAEFAAAVQTALINLDRIDTDVDSVSLVDSNGAILASSSLSDIGANIGQTDYYQEAIAGRPAISGVSLSLSTNEPVIYHAVPVRGPLGRTFGVLRSRASIERVRRSIEGAQNRVGAG